MVAEIDKGFSSKASPGMRLLRPMLTRTLTSHPSLVQNTYLAVLGKREAPYSPRTQPLCTVESGR